MFPKGVPHSGPQDIENGATDVVPGDHIERLLCALIGLALNRKKNVEYVFSRQPSSLRQMGKWEQVICL